MREKLFFVVVFLGSTAFAQNPPVNFPLLDHLAGNWTAQVSIAGQASTHDIKAKWVLGHHYLRLHEVSREKDANGNPQYEAMVFVTQRPKSARIACIWLDVFGGSGPSSIGVADPKEKDIPFVFKDDQGAVVFTNDFVYDPQTDTWQWKMDNVEGGKATPFGTEKLVRSK